MIGRQRVQVGLPHAGKTAEISITADTYRITVDDGPAITAARTSSHEIRRQKASHYVQQNQEPVPAGKANTSPEMRQSGPASRGRGSLTVTWARQPPTCRP